MRTENEIRVKIEKLMAMYDAIGNEYEALKEMVIAQVDMLRWVIGDGHGLPPLDEDPLYNCYNHCYD